MFSSDFKFINPLRGLVLSGLEYYNNVTSTRSCKQEMRKRMTSYINKREKFLRIVIKL